MASISEALGVTPTILAILVAVGIFAALMKAKKQIAELTNQLDELKGIKENTWEDNYEGTEIFDHRKESLVESVPSCDEHFHFNSGTIEVSYRKVNDD